MSVIVLGMEMPHTCEECRISIEVGSDMHCPLFTGDGHRDFGRKAECGFEFRPDWCPLRPLPEKHGRLIDEKELREAFGLGKDCAVCKQDIRDCQYNQIFTRMEFCGGIDDMKTIIVAEGD